MLTLKVISYGENKNVSLSLRGEGTIINTLVMSDHHSHVAKYISHYKPDKVEFNNINFENKVIKLLKDLQIEFDNGNVLYKQ